MNFYDAKRRAASRAANGAMSLDLAVAFSLMHKPFTKAGKAARREAFQMVAVLADFDAWEVDAETAADAYLEATDTRLSKPARDYLAKAWARA